MGDKEKHHYDYGALRALSLITQTGLSFCVPLVLCILAASFLQNRFGLGMWVMPVGILMGLASGVAGAVNVFRMMERLSRPGPEPSQKEEKDVR